MSVAYCPECGSNDLKVASLVYTWECPGCRKAFTIFNVAEDIGMKTQRFLFDQLVDRKVNEMEITIGLLQLEGNP